MTKVAAFDRDNTLAKPQGGNLGDPEALKTDPLWPQMKAWWDSVPLGVDRAVVTGREENLRPAMEEWFKSVGLEPDVLLMRADGDSTPNAEVKRQMLHQLQKDYDGVLYVVDDNPKAIDIYREKGVLAVDAKFINH